MLMRETTDGLRAPILDMNKGWAKLVFLGSDGFCDKPYPWKNSRDFKWQD
jgi:hypothetical protein